MRIFVRRGERGFTMVEVALSIGVVAIALVAILGILPSGMESQKETADSVLINEEAAIFMNAIRGGARGMDYLTNHVELVTRVEKRMDLTGRLVQPLVKRDVASRFRSGEEIVGSLVVPAIRRPILPYSKPTPYNRTNIQAIVRSLNASGETRVGDTNDATTFRYRLTTELNPAQAIPNPYDNRNSNTNLQNLYTNEMHFAANSMANLHELRLTIEWPVYQMNNEWRVGRNRKTYRTLLNGSLTNIVAAGQSYYFFEPNTYTNAALALLPQRIP